MPSDDWEEPGLMEKLKDGLGDFLGNLSEFTSNAGDKLKELYDGGEEWFYQTADELEEERNIPVKKYYVEPFDNAGIPAYPTTLFFIFLLLLALLWFIWPRGPLTLELTVLSGTLPIENAEVNIKGAEFEFTKITNAKGKVLFDEIKKGQLTLQVEHPDYDIYQTRVEITRSRSMQIRLNELPENFITFTINVADTENKPLNGVTLKILYEEKEVTKTTDVYGKSVLKLSPNTTLIIGAAKSGYQTASKKVNSDEGSIAITLYKKGEAAVEGDGDGKKPDGQAPDGVLKIFTVSDQKNPMRAIVKIYDSRTAGKQLKSIQTDSSGLATVEGLKVGTPLKIIASWNGYKDAIKKITLAKTSEVTLIMIKGKIETKQTEITVKDSKTQDPIEGAELRIFNLDNELIETFETDSKGKASGQLEVGEYYVVATAEKYEYDKGSLRAGDKKTIFLKRGDQVVFSILAKDEDGKTYHKTAINFYDLQGEFVPPFTVYTSFNGVVKTTISSGTYVIKATKDVLYGYKQIVVANISTGQEASVNMYYPRGYLKLDAKNIRTRETISPFTVSIRDTVLDQNIVSNNTCTNNCTFWIRAFRQYYIIGSAEDYEETQMPITVTAIDQNSNVPGEAASDGTRLNATFVLPRTVWMSVNDSANGTNGTDPLVLPLDFTFSSLIFEGLYPEDDESQNVSTVRRGRRYIARFAADFDEELDKKGMYARAGNMDSISGDPGFIEDLAPSDAEVPIAARGSNVWQPGQCNLAGISQISQVRHAVTEYQPTGVTTIKYTISIEDTIDEDVFAFLWQGRITRDDEISSTPPGAEDFYECSAGSQLHSEVFQVDTCGSLNNACCDDGCSEGLYCDLENICRDIGSRPPNIFECPVLQVNLSSGGEPRAGCDRVIFKVDSIFPADAIPLEVFDSQGRNTDNFDLRFTDKNEPTNDVSECFAWSSSFNNRGGKALRYWPRGSCPYKPVGNSIPDALFEMEIVDFISQKSKKMDIRVENEATMPFNVYLKALEASYTFYKGLPSASTMIPYSYYGSDSEDPSMFPVTVMNNRQLSVDTDDMYAGIYSGGNFKAGIPFKLMDKSDNKGSAKLFIWDLDWWNTFAGAGSPMQFHSSNTKDTNLITLQQTKAVGGFASLVDINANYDPASRFTFFKVFASAAAQRSAFRRAYNSSVSPVIRTNDLDDRAPYKYFVVNPADDPVKFSMVYTEHANAIYNILPSAYDISFIDLAQTQDHCMARQGIYKLTITSTDGLSWKYQSNKYGLEPMKIAYTTNNEACAEIYACNLINGKQISPSLKDCMRFEWPLVPDGRNPEDPADLRTYAYLLDVNLFPESFYLSPPSQETDLRGANIVYMDINGSVGTIDPYNIYEYPHVFTISDQWAQCNEGEISLDCVCEGSVQTAGSGYCCNDQLRNLDCINYLNGTCELGLPVNNSGSDGCLCGDSPIYEGFCCDNGFGTPLQNLEACLPLCVPSFIDENNQIQSECLCGGAGYESGYCCDNVYSTDPCEFGLTMTNPNVTLTDTKATIYWETSKATDNNYVLYGSTSPPEDGPAEDLALGIAHSVTLNGLLPDTDYYYDLSSCIETECVDWSSQFHTAGSSVCVPGESCEGTPPTYCTSQTEYSTDYAYDNDCNCLPTDLNPLPCGSETGTVNETCAEGEVLVNSCIPSCDYECSGGGVCDSSCSSPPTCEAECEIFRCTADSDCEFGLEICNLETGVCEEVSGACQVDSDCEPGFSCSNNVCREDMQILNLQPTGTLSTYYSATITWDTNLGARKNYLSYRESGTASWTQIDCGYSFKTPTIHHCGIGDETNPVGNPIDAGKTYEYFVQSCTGFSLLPEGDNRCATSQIQSFRTKSVPDEYDRWGCYIPTQCCYDKNLGNAACEPKCVPKSSSQELCDRYSCDDYCRSTSSSCTDTDGGDDPHIAGTASNLTESKTDQCAPLLVPLLAEAYCDGGNVATKTYACVLCLSGRCVFP